MKDCCGAYIQFGPCIDRCVRESGHDGDHTWDSEVRRMVQQWMEEEAKDEAVRDCLRRVERLTTAGHIGRKE